MTEATQERKCFDDMFSGAKAVCFDKNGERVPTPTLDDYANMVIEYSKIAQGLAATVEHLTGVRKTDLAIGVADELMRFLKSQRQYEDKYSDELARLKTVAAVEQDKASA